MLTGGLNLKTPLCLAPLAGITSLSIREFFSQHGASLTHTEMISCAGLIRDNAKTFNMLETSEFESPLVVQLFAPDENILSSGAECVMKICKRFSAFGINMACPMPKITKNGCGSALLKNPETASKMVKSIKNFGFPVWVKIRKLENENETLKFVETLINSGADNVCIHGRTPSQRYEGKADKNILRISAEKFHGFIGASGDVKTVDDINEYLFSGCSCVMLARGALSNPFLFEEFSGKFRSYKEKVEELIKFARNAEKITGDHKALVMMKKFVPGLLKFSEGSAEKRNSACMAVKLNELIKILLEGV